MSTSTRNYWSNLIRLLRGDRLLRPLVTVYYVTTRCNLDCAYCEDFGARRNSQAALTLSLDDALRVLRVIRSGVDNLILTGGEPLLYPDIVPLITRARRELDFRRLTLLTNGFLLSEYQALLPDLDRLVISLDSVDPERWSSIVNAPVSVAQTILDNVIAYAHRQREFGYRMMVNCVLTPETLPGAGQVLDFCIEHDLSISFSPQAVGNWPRYDLLVSDEYKAFLTRLIALKRRGAPVVGSMAYLRTLLDFFPYSCYPTLSPRVMPNGDLVYPCRPIEKEGGSHGGRASNLLEVESWDHALEISAAAYGLPPRVCTSCFQQCFAEPSLMQAHPLALLRELLRYPTSRQSGLASYAPG